MDFSNAIQSVMDAVRDGSAEPFMIYRDTDGGWRFGYTQNQYGDTFDWVEDAAERDPFAMTYTGKDFSNGSYPYVYDRVLRDRVHSEYHFVSESGQDTDNLYALTGFFEDNAGSLSHTVTDYLTTLERPLAALAEMCPLDLKTNYEDWTYNESLAEDAISLIENSVNERLENRTIQFSDTIGKVDAGYESHKLNEYDPTHIISTITLNGYLIDLGEDTEHEKPYYVETRKGGDTGEWVFDMRTENYTEALKAYSEQMLGIANEIQLDRNVEYQKLTASECLPDSKNADYTKQLIIVDSAALLPEYRSSTSQLIECSHGNGARPNAIGRSVFGKELYSGDSVVYDRSNILGVADEDKLPRWAKIKLEIRRDPSVFEYGGYHFKPEHQFLKGEVDKPLAGDSRPWKKDAQYAMRNMESDSHMGLSTYKSTYRYDDFYAAAGGKPCDIFRCVENGKLYVPAANELFRYNESPDAEKAKQVTKTGQTSYAAPEQPQNEKTAHRKPATLQEKLDKAKKQAAAQDSAKKDGRGDKPKKRGERE